MEFQQQELYWGYIHEALDGTLLRMNQHPENDLFKSIQRQLLLIRQIIFEEHRLPGFEEKNAVFISSLARNHFAKGNTYGDNLLRINYWFNHLIER